VDAVADSSGVGTPAARPLLIALPAAVSDVSLVRAAQAGDREAFGELYRRFSRAVHGVLLARLPRAAADDLVQEAFLQALRRLGELREPAAFAGWLCTIARRCAADHYRRAPAEDPLADEAAEAARQASPELVAEANAAVAAIQNLPEAYRETLTLRLVEGLSGPEIGAATGLTADSVRVNLHRGFRLLRERLGVTP
jgi:RNA polymerase sigma-70 factor (ECF subfamily)